MLVSSPCWAPAHGLCGGHPTGSNLDIFAHLLVLVLASAFLGYSNGGVIPPGHIPEVIPS